MSAALANLHPDLQDLVGRTIAERYRVDALLGVGGMGAVFRGHHLGLHRDVAIKVLHPSLTRDPEIKSRFDREARSASRLDHPNCLQITDYGTTEHDMKFMVMQLLDGGELTKLLGKPLAAERALELTLQICRGLEHAHGQGVIHRDVKPENVFVTRDHADRETLKLVDFGIAKIAGGGPGEQHKTRAGLIFGTPAYMSPEQAAGVEADARADLYSLGIIMYEMLAGHPPFRADDPVALVRMQVGADPPPLPPDTAPMVAAITERLLAKRRDDRFSSAREVREILEAALVMLRGEVSNSGVVETAVASLHSGGIPLALGAGPSGSIPISTGSSHSTGIPIAGTGTTMAPMALEPERSRSRLGLGLAALAVVGAAAWFVVPRLRDGGATTTTTVSSGSPNEDGALAARNELGGDDSVQVIAANGPDAEALAEIDRLLLSGKLDEADKLLAALRDEYTKDPQLSWRLGRLLTKRKGKRTQALMAYGVAIEGDPTLLDNNEFYAELHDLLRTPNVRDEALDLALHSMGRYAHSFLLELVNNEKKPLSYAKRHRALDELATVPENEAMINRQLNTALDLLQAHQSLTPCKSYDDGLSAIAAAPEYYYLARVQRATPPVADPSAVDAREDAAACEDLEARRQALLAQLATLQPDAGDTDGEIVIDEDGGTQPAPKADPAKPAPKPAAKPAAKKKKSTADDCNRLRDLKKKKCWR